MSRLNLPSLRHLAKRIFSDHPLMPSFDLIYEMEEDLITSENLLGSSDLDFEPNWFSGLVFIENGVASLEFGYSFNGSESENINIDEIIEQIAGVTLVDNDLIEMLAPSPIYTIAGIAAQKTGDEVIARLYFNPLLTRIQAIGLLKGALDYTKNKAPIKNPT